MWRLRLWLDKLLALFSKTRLSDEELIAYGRQLEREEQRKQREVESVRVWFDPNVRSYPPGRASIPLTSPYYIAQIHTQHSLPSLPRVPVRSPLRASRLTKMIEAIAPTLPIPPAQAVPTPLPLREEEEEEEYSEIESWEDRFLLGMTATTEKREAV